MKILISILMLFFMFAIAGEVRKILSGDENKLIRRKLQKRLALFVLATFIVMAFLSLSLNGTSIRIF